MSISFCKKEILFLEFLHIFCSTEVFLQESVVHNEKKTLSQERQSYLAKNDVPAQLGMPLLAS